MQREIIGKVRYVQNVERPFSDWVMKDQKQKFTAWIKQRQETIKLAMGSHLPEKLHLDLDKEKVPDLNSHDELV